MQRSLSGQHHAAATFFLSFCVHSYSVHGGVLGTQLLVLFCESFSLTAGSCLSHQVECARRADSKRMRYKAAATVLRSCEKQYSKTPWVYFSVNSKEKYDPGNIKADNALTGYRSNGRYAHSQHSHDSDPSWRNRPQFVMLREAERNLVNPQ